MSTAESTWSRSAGGDRLRKLFSLQPGETPRLVCLLLQSLFLGIFTALYLSTALAVFLDSFPISILPFAYIASSLVGFVGVTLFTRLARRVPADRLVILPLAVLIAASAAFWGLSLAAPRPWIAFAMAVGIAPAITLLDLGFWTIAGRLLDLRQGKRLAGLISAGEVVASILGFFLIPVLLPLLGRPIHLLPIAAAGLALCAVVVAFTGRRYRELLAAEAAEPREIAGDRRRALPALLTTRYFALIALSLTLFTAAFYLIDFAFLSEVPAFFKEGSGQVAQFLGLFFGAAKICELLVKTFLSGRLLSQFGLRAGLLLLPAALLGCVLFAVAAGAVSGSGSIAFFVLVALAKLVWTMLARSIFDPSYRMLYQPLPAASRLAFQTGLEGQVRQIAVFLVGTTLALAAGHGAGVLPLLAALLPALGAWIFVVVLVYREYRNRLLRTLSGDLSVLSTLPDLLAAPDQEPVVRRRIEELAERIAWDTAALLDLERAPATPAAAATLATSRSLALDLAAKRRSLFELLAQLYDPQVIEQVQRSLADAGGGASVYAIEILDVLMSPDLKALVLPLLEAMLEGRDAATGLHRLEAIAPQQRLAPLERLSDLLHREPGSVGLGTRACALAALGELAGEVRADLVAYLFHPERLLQEGAAAAIHRIDPAAYALHVRKLPAADRERLDRVVDPTIDSEPQDAMRLATSSSRRRGGSIIVSGASAGSRL